MNVKDTLLANSIKKIVKDVDSKNAIEIALQLKRHREKLKKAKHG